MVSETDVISNVHVNSEDESEAMPVRSINGPKSQPEEI